jgi:hypothetical protein
MKAFVRMIGVVLSLGMASVAASHSFDEIQKAFEDSKENVPIDLAEITRILNNTAGTSSVREQVHTEQHRLLLEYVQARMKRKCADLTVQIPELDEEIIRLRDEARREEERHLREVRDNAQTFITANCRSVEPNP